MSMPIRIAARHEMSRNLTKGRLKPPKLKRRLVPCEKPAVFW